MNAFQAAGAVNDDMSSLRIERIVPEPQAEVFADKG